jgi:hypothetical protein
MSLAKSLKEKTNLSVIALVFRELLSHGFEYGIDDFVVESR